MLFIRRSFGPRPVPSYFFLTKHLQISQLHKQNMPTAAIIGDISPIPSVSSSGTNTRTGRYWLSACGALAAAALLRLVPEGGEPVPAHEFGQLQPSDADHESVGGQHDAQISRTQDIGP